MLHHTRVVAAALTAAVALLAALALPASATTAHGSVVATPANDSAHPWPTDGCSASPERGPGWDFHHACVHHDGCYRGHWARRGTCDGWFHRDLRASCVVLHASAWSRWPCYVLAAAYYGAVRAFGGTAYADHSVKVPVR